VQLPPSQPDPTLVEGYRNGQWVPLREYNDLLPVPAAIKPDSDPQHPSGDDRGR
jgi:hypothetical protein